MHRVAAGLWGALLACVFSTHTLAAQSDRSGLARRLPDAPVRAGGLESPRLLLTVDRPRPPPRSAPSGVLLDAWSEPFVGAELHGAQWRLSAFSERNAHVLLGTREWSVSSPEGPRRLSLEYMLNAPQARLTIRAGYRYGLPFDEVERVDDTVLLAAGGTLSVSAGTIAWLQLDFAGFRELAGARLLRLDAVPGIRVRPWKLPLELGAGLLVAFVPGRDGRSLEQRLTRVLQLGGTF